MLSAVESAIRFLVGDNRAASIRDAATSEINSVLSSDASLGGSEGPDRAEQDGPALFVLLDEDSVDWDRVHRRLESHPHEATMPRVPSILCTAIDKRAPPDVVSAILTAHPPSARELVHWHSRLTPLYLAVARGSSPDVIRLILDANPAAAQQAVFNGCLPLHASTDAETARMLLDAFPRGVAYKNEQGYLPLHRVSYASDSTADVVQLLVDEGMKRNVGGPSGGGGVFETTQQGITPLSAVCCTITGGRQVDEFRSVRDVESLSRPARNKWEKLLVIVRAAASSGATGGGGDTQRKKRRNDAEANPGSGSGSGGRKFHIVHSLIDLGCPDLVLSFALRTDPTQGEQVDDMGRTALALACQRRDSSPALIGMLLDPTQCGNSDAAAMSDKSGRLPLHLAVMSGRDYDDGMRCIIRAAPQALELRDGRTGLLPFMIAAIGCEANIDTIFGLLKESPWLVQASSYDGAKHRRRLEQRTKASAAMILTLSWILIPVFAAILPYLFHHLFGRGEGKWGEGVGVSIEIEIPNLNLALDRLLFQG